MYIYVCIKGINGDINNYMMDGVWKAKLELSPNCPRCGSSNTKFCYYNNYSLKQPRYFCKGCRRYWTKGGSLRNVPVGGGCRKNRRGKSFRILTDRPASEHLAGDPDRSITGSTASASNSNSNSNSNIDLALVYANFLNQKPAEPKSNNKWSEIQESPCEFHPSFQLSTNSNLESSHVQLPPPDAAHLSSEDNLQVCLGGFHPINIDHGSANIYGLPPLPDQEVASDQEAMLWPISSQVMVQNQTFHQTHQLPGLLHPEAPQDQNVAAAAAAATVAGNWTPFDFSCYETFSRP